MSILPDSAHIKTSGGDPEYKAAVEAVVRARTAVTNRETEANFYAAKSRTQMDRDRAMRDSGSFSTWTLAQRDLEKVCLEIDSYRLQRLSSAQFRTAEVARLRALTKSLMDEASLTPDAFRQKELARIAEEAKNPEQSISTIRARIAAATRDRDTLAKTPVK